MHFLNDIPKEILSIILRMVNGKTKANLRKTCKIMNYYFPQPSLLVTKQIYQNWFSSFETLLGYGLLELISISKNLFFICKSTDQRLYFVYKENITEYNQTYSITLINHTKISIIDFLKDRYSSNLTLHKNYVIITFNNLDCLSKFLNYIYCKVVVDIWEGTDISQFLRILFSTSLRTNDIYSAIKNHFLYSTYITVLSKSHQNTFSLENESYKKNVDDLIYQIKSEMVNCGLDRKECCLFIKNKRFD